MHVCKVWWDSEVNNVWVKVKVCCRSGMLVIRHSDSGRYADALMATGSRPKLVTETWVACRSRRWAVLLNYTLNGCVELLRHCDARTVYSSKLFHPTPFTAGRNIFAKIGDT